MARSFHHVKVDGEQVQLRVFVPPAVPGESRPAVVMVCGLLWMGGGLLGRIGLGFNDGFGWAFAAGGVPCVQVHTPCRHIAYTRLMDLVMVLALPLGLLPIFRLPLIVGDVLMLGIIPLDLVALLLLPLAARLGPFALPCFHLATRAVQWLRGAFLGPSPRPHQKDIAATVAWTRENQALLGSDGRLVLCGYSSGGHCAALFGLSPESPRFEAVVLISGIYSLRTDVWSGMRRWLAPAFNMLFQDILGVCTPEEREVQSPEAAARRSLNGQDWYVLSARMELMRLQPFEDILFQAGALCEALTAKEAKVHRVTCGLNHWLLVLNIADFVHPFSKSLIRR